ncbi:MAG: hypothetical protein ACHQWU_04505 [Gemmatimonadales bacterium]
MSNDVTVVDASKSRIVARIPVGQRPWGIALAN